MKKCFLAFMWTYFSSSTNMSIIWLISESFSDLASHQNCQPIWNWGKKLITLINLTDKMYTYFKKLHTSYFSNTFIHAVKNKKIINQKNKIQNLKKLPLPNPIVGWWNRTKEK
jgi:hypothetical protein